MLDPALSLCIQNAYLFASQLRSVLGRRHVTLFEYALVGYVEGIRKIWNKML